MHDPHEPVSPDFASEPEEYLVHDEIPETGLWTLLTFLLPIGVLGCIAIYVAVMCYLQ